MRQLAVNTARYIMVFMTDASDHITGKAGLTLTITASKAGGAFAAITPTVADLGSGWYSLYLTAAHTNTLGDFALHVTAALADPTDIAAEVVTEVEDKVWDEVLTGATHNVPTSAGRRLRTLGAVSITDGTASAGTVNSITLEAGSSATNNIYNQNLIAIVAGMGVGQCRLIAEYNGSTLKAIVDRNWDITPNATSEYMMVAFSGILLTGNGLATGGGASTITLAATESSVDDIYVGSMVVLTTGSGPGQARLITAYNGTSKIATVSPAWTTQPDATTVYKIIPVGRSIINTLESTATAEITTALLAMAYEDSETFQTFLRLMRAGMAGVTTGHPTTPLFKSKDGTKTRITATLDADGNRSAVSVDGS